MFLSDLSIKQPVFATMLAVSLMTLGIYSYRQLSIDQFPDVEIPVLTVQTLYPGASPETVEREVTKRIEEALYTIAGVRHISSSTTEGLSAVAVEFRLGTRIANAQQDAQANVDGVHDLRRKRCALRGQQRRVMPALHCPRNAVDIKRADDRRDRQEEPQRKQ